MTHSPSRRSLVSPSLLVAVCMLYVAFAPSSLTDVSAASSFSSVPTATSYPYEAQERRREQGAAAPSFMDSLSQFLRFQRPRVSASQSARTERHAQAWRGKVNEEVKQWKQSQRTARVEEIKEKKLMTATMQSMELATAPEPEIDDHPLTEMNLPFYHMRKSATRSSLPAGSGRAPWGYSRDVGNGSAVVGNPDPWNFIVAVAPGAPMVFEDKTKTGNERYSGIMIDLWDKLVESINAQGASYTYTLYTSPAGGSTGDCEQIGASNYECTGLIDEMWSGRADVGLGAVTITSLRNQAVSFPFGILQVGKLVLVKAKSPITVPLSFLDPFSKQLWLAVLGIAGWMTFGFYLVNRLSAYGYYSLPPKDGDRSNLNLSNSFFSSFGVLIGGDFDPGRSWSIKLMQLVYLFFVMILSATYTANLAAFLTNKPAVLKVLSFEDLQANPNQFCVVAGSSTLEWFNMNPDIGSMLDYATVAASATECMNLLNKDEVYAFVHSSPTIEYLLSQPPCDSLQVGDLVGHGSMGFPLHPKNSIKHALNQQTLYLVEEGVVDSIVDSFYARVTQCTDSAYTVSTGTPVMDVQDLVGLFYMMLVLPALGLFFNLIEFLIYSWRRYMRNRLKSNPQAKFGFFDFVARQMHDCMGRNGEEVDEEEEVVSAEPSKASKVDMVHTEGDNTHQQAQPTFALAPASSSPPVSSAAAVAASAARPVLIHSYPADNTTGPATNDQNNAQTMQQPTHAEANTNPNATMSG